MFPNKSSSYEISSKTNAFVQNNNEEDKSESLRGFAQPLKPASPTLQVPEKRDVMVVESGVSVGGDPVLTVIANHPSRAPAEIPSSQNDVHESDGSSRMPQAETRRTGALCLDSIKSTSVNDSFSVKDKFITSYRSESSTQLYNIPKPNEDTDKEGVNSFTEVCDYYTRWGIPRSLKLKGGGENSLTTGTTNWGSPPNQSSGSSGWTSSSNNSGGGGGGGGGGNPGQNQGGAQQSQGAPAPPNPAQNWGANPNNPSNQPANNNSGVNNSGGNRGGQQQTAGGGGGQQTGGGPPSQSTAPPAQSTTQSTSTVSTAPSSSLASSTTTSTTAAVTPASQQNGTTPNGTGGSTWAAAAGKGLPPTSTATTPTSTGNTSTKQQMEQLNTMREALYSQDGWGGQNVNQDSNWDIPGSPEPGSKEGGTAAPVPLWKLPINNGTDLWEANLRNGGIPPPATQQSQKTPWGHTPTSNIGGMWGEDDEGDASNVWTGVPPAPAVSGGPQWPNQPPPTWPGKKEGDWNGPNWNDQRDPRDRHNEMRQMMEAREHIRPTSLDHRGDPRGGISGRLNGVSTEGMWPGGPGGPHHHMPHHQGKIPTQPNQPGVNQWVGGGGGGGAGGPPMKEMGGLGGSKSGWEEPSPPAQRRNMPNYDDGTSLWGGPQHPRPSLQGGQNKVSHWKEMPAPGIGRGGLQCPPGRTNPTMKPDQPLWPHHPRNGAGWADSGMDGGPWADDKPSTSVAPWMEQGLGAPSSWQSGPKHKPAWDGSDLDPASWIHSKQPSKSQSKDYIWASKQFRILSEMGFKKDDIENALRSCSMVLEDALDQLNSNSNRSLGGGGGGERWPRHGDLDPDHVALMNSAFPSPQQAICLAPFPSGGSNGSGSSGPGGQTLATISPAVMQKLLAQQPPQQQPFAQQSSRSQQTQPSAQQLRMLVQQIQMAVQSGYLSPQILNQPLAPQTLLLLNQLLQQIKNLQQLMQHHSHIQLNPLTKGSSNHILQLSVQITKTKQQITNLQNQIAAQQAVYVKHQQQTPQTSEFFKAAAIHEPSIPPSLHSNFADLSLKEPPTGGTSQQSRLTQWKLPALDKDSDLGSGGEFSRAPGTTAKSAPGSSSPNTNLLLGQADGTWSSVNREAGWPDSSVDDNSGKDWPSSSQPPSQAFSDLVPEFEPGKPWKGNPLKSIEDDPSLTPGSVVRSPLSLPSIKDTHILSSSGGQGGKASPTTSSSLDIMPLGLSSSTWSFNPPPSSGNSGGGGGGASNGASKNSSSTWDNNSSELWGAPAKRGPPPGLPPKPGSSSSGGQAANGWGSSLSAAASSRWPGSQGWPGSSQQAPPSQPASTWLLLRNLTPQIDGSTLKTLCLQHGPLQNFHLYLNHGIALAKYTSREEANKAQGALNNCVLGNTTIFAESPGESDVLNLLQHLSGGGGGGGGGGGNSWRGKEPWGNSPLWGGGGGGSGGASLWADGGDQHRATPSSINSFLPGDLLGNESI